MDRRRFLAAILGSTLIPFLPELPCIPVAPAAEAAVGPGGLVWRTITLTARELPLLTAVPNELLIGNL